MCMASQFWVEEAPTNLQFIIITVVTIIVVIIRAERYLSLLQR